MERYNLICEVNRKQVFGENISEQMKADIVFALLKDIEPDRILSDLRKQPHTDKRPYFFYPPYNNGKKLRLIQGYMPKTNILYYNHYELEILRLLGMYAPSEPKAALMIESTLKRLKNTCFGKSCTQGECFPAGISVLRLLSVLPNEDEWIDVLLRPLGEAFMSFGNNRAVAQRNVPFSYLLMALTDINNETAIKLIDSKKKWLLDLSGQDRTTGRLSGGRISEGDTFKLMSKYIVRNALGILPEYANISERKDIC